MCLIVYIATRVPLPVDVGPRVQVRTMNDEQSAVREWFSLPNVAEISTDQGCGCGFRNILSDAPIDYFEGMFAHEDSDERREHDEFFAGLLRTLEVALSDSEYVELYSVWVDEERLPPKQKINHSLRSWTPERGFLHERFFFALPTDRVCE